MKPQPGEMAGRLSLPEPRLALVTRYALQTHDQAVICIATRGVRWGPPETLARIFRGEPVDPAEYYFRIAVQLATGGPARRHTCFELDRSIDWSSRNGYSRSRSGRRYSARSGHATA